MPTNVNEYRAAKREVEDVGPVVIFGKNDDGTDHEFMLPVEMPGDVILTIAEMQAAMESKNVGAMALAIREVFASLLGDEFPEFMRNRPSLDEMLFMVQGVMEEYGTSLGEPPASEGSSPVTLAQ